MESTFWRVVSNQGRFKVELQSLEAARPMVKNIFELKALLTKSL